MIRQHTTFDELCDAARARGLEAGLVVPVDRTEPERRDITDIALTRRATPKGVAVHSAPCTLDTLDGAAALLLRAIR